MSSSSSVWSEVIPDDLLVHIFLCLPLQDRIQSSYVCKRWYDCFQSVYLWQHFNFNFFTQTDRKLIRCSNQLCERLQSVCITLNPGEEYNRQNAVDLIMKLASTEKRRLKAITIIFRGDNPLFYAGKEFCMALSQLFQPMNNGLLPVEQLKHVDFSGLTVAYDDSVMDVLAKNHPNIEFLNLQNRNLLTLVSPTCMCGLVIKCRKLKDLRIFYGSLSEAILDALGEDDRTPLEFLSLSCRRTEKYGTEIPSESWKKVTKQLPKLRIGLVFDATVPVHKMWEIMKTELPLSFVRFDTFTDLIQEINFVAENYHRYLEKISINTTSSSILDKALIKLAACCERLTVLYVFCVVSQETIDQILTVCPSLRKSGNFLLKAVKETHPWGDPREIERLFVYHRLKS
ncbi:F-box/LRR-repeat protein 8-like [Tubulanus polymorphus]|uniref:F-box/LRR-repeat protein 8-like n=1 Tax=Tubulanus polymorphus TaxID=672921 RepID=UPI003DA416A8